MSSLGQLPVGEGRVVKEGVATLARIKTQLSYSSSAEGSKVRARHLSLGVGAESIFPHLPRYACACAYMCLCVCIYVCLCVFIYVCLCVFIYVCLCVCVYVCMCVCLHIRFASEKLIAECPSLSLRHRCFLNESQQYL